MSAALIQSMVNCGSSATTVAGGSSIEWSTNGSDWTTVSITGWRPFRDYLSTMSSALPGALSITYSTTTDRCTVAVSDSTTYPVRGTASTAKLLGFNNTTVATGGSDTAGDYAPRGVCPLSGLHLANPKPARASDVRTFRHGVTHSTSFGEGTIYDVRGTIAHADRVRLQEGPCSIGKVRIGEWAAGAVYSSSALGGYLDAVLVQQPSIAPADTVEQNIDFSFIAIAPSTAHDTAESMGDPVFGSLKRGYSLNYYARIEGIPYIFTEAATGITSSAYTNHTESATLVISDGTTITQKIERSRGLLASTGLRLGILDPTNALGLFKRPTLKIALGADLAHNGTTATIDQDSGATSDWPAGGAATASFYLGKEFVKYGAKATANFSSLTRGNWGPVYEYKSKGPGSFATLSDTPQVWRGRIVEVWGMLLDPFGAPVASDFDDAYTRAVFTGDLQSQPGFDSGVWVLNCSDLIRRLATSTGVTASGKCAAQHGGKDIGSTLIRLESGAKVTLIYSIHASSADAHVSESEIIAATALLDIATGIGVWADATAAGYTDIRTLMQAAFWRTHNHNPGWSGGGGGSDAVLGTHGDFGFGSSDGNFRLGSDGIDFDYAAHKKDEWGTSLAVLLHTQGQAVQTPIMEVAVTSFGLGENESWEKPAEISPKLSGKAVDYLIVREDAAMDALAGSFASSGHLVVGDGKDAELVQYTTKESIYPSGCVCFTGLTRGVGGTPRADFFDSSLAVHQAHREEAVAFGDLMAKVIESSGIAASLRGTFDDFTDEGVGYGIDDDHVLDSGSGLAPSLQTKIVADHCGLPADLSVVMSGKQMTFAKMFEGLLAAKRQCVGWVRAGQRLKIGVVRTVASASYFETMHTVKDADLQLTSAARIADITTPPNIINISRVPTMLDDSKDTGTVRVIPDIAARGGKQTKLNLYGLNGADFSPVAQVLAMGMIEETGASVAYEIKVAGWHDWMAGDLIKFDGITHGALWDWTSDSAGLDCYGRILEVRRNLTSGDVSLRVLVEGNGFAQLLCPCATVSANSSNQLTVDSVDYFQDDDPVSVYTPGVSGSYEEFTISSINTSTKVITLSGTPASVTNSITVVSYPSNDNGAITAVQDSHAHVADGGQWD